MVVPSSVANAGSSDIGLRGYSSERVTKTLPKVTAASSADSEDVAAFVRMGKESKEETWFDFFFGPAGVEPKVQSNQAHEQEGRDEQPQRSADVEHVATWVRNDNSQQQQRLDGNVLTGFLSWFDNGAAFEFGLSPDKDVIKGKSQDKARVGDNMRRKASSNRRKKTMSVGANKRLSDPPAEGSDAASEDSSVEDSKLFQDLESVPSSAKLGTIEDLVRVDGADVHDSSVDTSISNSALESKIDSLKMPKDKGGIMPLSGATTSKESNSDSAKTAEARKQLLVKELRSAIAVYGRYDVKTASISASLGDILDECKQPDQAIKLHRDAIEIYSSKLGDDHATTLEAKLQLAKVLENSGKLDEAINIYFLVTVMRRAINGDKDSSAADSLVLMAHALRKKDDYQQAIKELKRALKIYRESLGDSHQKVSTTVDEIASLYVTVGDFQKSAAILEEVVKLKAVTHGIQSAAVAATLCSLATTYECSEDFSKAMKSLKKAYKIYTEMDGYSSKEATNTLNRIAQLYEAGGDNDRASIAYLGVLRGRKINHGEDHLLVAETYYKLGHTLRESGQYDKALKCLKEGLPIFVKKGVEMNDVEMVAEVMHEMALIHKERKKFLEASRIFKQELGVRRKIGQADYPMIARTLNHLGVTEYEMKNNNKSLKYLVEALTIFKDQAEGSVECAEVLFNTGLVFESSKNRERAMEAYEEAARIFKEHNYQDKHPHLAKALRKIEKLQAQKNGLHPKP